MALPGVVGGAKLIEGYSDFGFSVPVKGKLKAFLWTWKERVDPKKARVPNLGVFAVRVSSLAQKDLMISAEPAKYFTEPHYNGYPAVLVRLKVVKVSDLRPLLAESWACVAPKELLEAKKQKSK